MALTDAQSLTRDHMSGHMCIADAVDSRYLYV